MSSTEGDVQKKESVESQHPMQTDVESQTPVYATNVQPVNVIYVPREEQILQDNEHDPWIGCAIFGLLFSWIPIIGCLTCIANMDAPQGSFRAAIARAACSVAMLVVLFNIIFWSWYN